MSEPAPTPSGGPSPYAVAYIVAAILFLINVAIAGIQAAYAAGHGADLGITPQLQAWLAIVSAVIAAALGFLPQLGRTPATRETSYLKASQGILPMDLEKKYPSATRKPFHPV